MSFCRFLARNHRIGRLGLLPLAAGAAVVAITGAPAHAELLPKPSSLLGSTLYRPNPQSPCLRVYPLCLPDRSEFTSTGPHTP